jgi:hypothetical protein
MIDPKPLFQPHIPLEIRTRFSLICRWKRLRIVTVVEMQDNLDSAYLRIRPMAPVSEEEAFRLDLAFSPRLNEAMSVPVSDRRDGSLPLRFNWFPLEAPQ